MPAYGGKYKGHRFRSLLELSVMLSSEKEGLILGQDLLYETVRIPYGKSGRTYIVDFLMPSEQVLIEVKPKSRTSSKTFKSKCNAAIKYAHDHSLTFIVLTENDIDPIVTFEQAKLIDGIEWGERARRKLRRKKR